MANTVIFPVPYLYPLYANGTCYCWVYSEYAHMEAVQKRSPHDQIALFLKIKPIKATAQQAISYYFSLQLGRLLETGMSLQQALYVFEGQDYLRFLKKKRGG